MGRVRPSSAILRAGSALPALLFVSPVLAHGDHGGGGGIVLPPGTTLVTLSYDVAKYRPVSDERLLELSARGESAHGIRQISVPALSIAYGIAQGLTVGVRAPYLANKSISETGEDPAEPGVVRRGGVYGLGDTTFTATYELLHDDANGIEASISAGFKAPTGRKDAVDKVGVLFETEHQPGSGSWDGVFGAAIAKHIDALTLAANATYGLAGPGSQDTTLGDRVSYGISASYRLWQLSTSHEGHGKHGGEHHEDTHQHQASHPGHVHESGGMAFDVSLGLNGQWWDKLTAAGVRDDNIGGHVLYVSPGMRLTVDGWTGFVSASFPVYSRLNGTQSEPDWQLSTGVSLQF